MKFIKYALPISLSVVLIAAIGFGVGFAANIQNTFSIAGSKQNYLWRKAFWRSATVADVQKLIANGADVTKADEQGMSPLALAAMISQDEEIIELLVDAGADVNAPTADWGWTPLFWAAMNNTNPQIIKTLVEKGANVEERCVGIHSTPLIDAVVHNPSSAVVQALLDAGANPNAKDDKGLSAIDYVRMDGNHHKDNDVYQMLVSR